MSFKIVFGFALLCVANASVIINVFDEDDSLENAESSHSRALEDCNNQNCDQTCRRIGYTGGVCVNGRCKCDINLNVLKSSESEHLLEDTQSQQPLQDCNNQNCDQTCRRIGYTGGVCVNGRCKCDINLKEAINLVQSVLPQDCNFIACDQLCRRLGFLSGACTNGRCVCDIILSFAEDFKKNTLDSEIELRDCNFAACDQLCRRLGFPGGACVNGRCKCDNFRNQEVTPINDATPDKIENPKLVVKTDEVMLNLPAVADCDNTVCQDICRRLNYPDGICRQGECECF